MASDHKPAPSAVSNDPLEAIVALMSELPTERAMKDIGQRNNVSPATRMIVETMAVYKEDLVKAMVHIVKRERAMRDLLNAHYNIEEMQKFTDIDWSTLEITFDANKKN